MEPELKGLRMGSLSMPTAQHSITPRRLFQQKARQRDRPGNMQLEERTTTILSEVDSGVLRPASLGHDVDLKRRVPLGEFAFNWPGIHTC